MPGVDSRDCDPLPDTISPKDLSGLLEDIGATPASLKRDAAALREWVNAEPHLPNLTSDLDEWLEIFLVVSKNSMERAKERLDKYFSSRTALAEWFVVPPPPLDRFILEDTDYLQGGYVPRLLPGGYCLYIEKAVIPAGGSWAEYDLRLHYQRALLHTEGMFGRCKKIRGVVFIFDQKNINMSVATTLVSDLGVFRKWMSCVQDAMPTSVKAIHVINSTAPSLTRMMLNTVTPLMKAKIAQRIIIHDNLKSLHEHIPPEYLPEEYGGTHKTTMEEMGTVLGNFILSEREWFASRAWMKTNESLRRVKKSSDFGIEGSFRKLEVD
ncbi:Alpha-tocopherol transfer protein-like [Frankliniella fusca]|uniref:Alpha-tocopherol transfer protein-like n=1 Tax=Frankliniella fusca TaxID=407009 RepID=A0AAE1HW04_9NEOP|nr:Alpha-tocopherol transfer protein-like [Frankliniella fusca]